MDSLSQMLEDYRNKKREIPNYEELLKVSQHIELVEKQLIELSIENRKLQMKVSSC